MYGLNRLVQFLHDRGVDVTARRIHFALQERKLAEPNRISGMRVWTEDQAEVVFQYFRDRAGASWLSDEGDHRG